MNQAELHAIDEMRPEKKIENYEKAKQNLETAQNAIYILLDTGVFPKEALSPMLGHVVMGIRQFENAINTEREKL